MLALRVLRILLEILGLALAGYMALVSAILMLYSGSLIVLSFVVGYLLLPPALWALRKKSGTGLGWRLQLDCALIALAPATGLMSVAVSERWPIRRPRVDAHGWGMSGGEANVVLLSWMHALFWLAIVGVLYWRRGKVPRLDPRRADAHP